MPDGNRLYRDALLDHFRHPRNKGDLSDATVTRRGHNPTCGDEIEVGLDHHETGLTARFRGRGCAVCIASASLMTEALRGKTPAEAKALSDQVQRWLTADPVNPEQPPAGLEPLSAVRDHTARHRCVRLAWEAAGAAAQALTHDSSQSSVA